MEVRLSQKRGGKQEDGTGAGDNLENTKAANKFFKGYHTDDDAGPLPTSGRYLKGWGGIGKRKKWKGAEKATYLVQRRGR